MWEPACEPSVQPLVVVAVSCHVTRIGNEDALDGWRTILVIMDSGRSKDAPVCLLQHRWGIIFQFMFANLVSRAHR